QLELVVERERVSVLQGFIRDATHDLYTPLSVLQTSLYLLRRTIDDPERRESHLNELENQVAHLQQLVQNLLVMSRLDSADMQAFDFQPNDLNVLVDDIVHEQRRF